LSGISAVVGLLAAVQLGSTASIFVLPGIAFVPGFVLNLISIVLIVVPMAMLVLRKMAVDDVWFCIMFLVLFRPVIQHRRWRLPFFICAAPVHHRSA
jgi:TRAP-type mannitol/chloroaromatic compound transport system permease large subunit